MTYLLTPEQQYYADQQAAQEAQQQARYALNAQLNLAQQQQRRSTSEIPGAQSVMRRFGY